MNFGVIGYGNVARKKFFPAMSYGGDKASAVLLPSEEYSKSGIKTLRSSTGCHITDNAQEFFKLPMDAVYIASPPSTHHGYAYRALESGKHVLCEKPIGCLPGSVDVLIKMARKEGLVLMENFPCFLHPQWDWMKQVFKDDRVHFLSMAFGGPLVPSSWRLFPKELGVIGDFIVYAPAMLIYLTGEQPHCTDVHVGLEEGVPFISFGCFQTSGVPLQFSVSYNARFISQAFLWGDKSWMGMSKAFNPTLFDGVHVKFFTGEDDIPQSRTFRKFNIWTRQLEVFKDNVQSESMRESNYKNILMQSIALRSLCDMVSLEEFLNESACSQ